MGDEPHEAIPATPQGTALGESVKAGLDRAGALAKDAADKTRDTLAGYRDGGLEQIAEDVVEYVRSQRMTALLIATRGRRPRRHVAGAGPKGRSQAARVPQSVASATLAVLSMPSREPELPETEDRRCPYCRYQRLAQEGHVTIAQGMIKETLRCEVCGVWFALVRKVSG